MSDGFHFVPTRDSEGDSDHHSGDTSSRTGTDSDGGSFLEEVSSKLASRHSKKVLGKTSFFQKRRDGYDSPEDDSSFVEQQHELLRLLKKAETEQNFEDLMVIELFTDLPQVFVNYDKIKAQLKIKSEEGFTHPGSGSELKRLTISMKSFEAAGAAQDLYFVGHTGPVFIISPQKFDKFTFFAHVMHMHDHHVSVHGRDAL